MWGRGTVLGGRYTLAERIGGGGMGEVWRADDGVLERQVAVKILLPGLLKDEAFARRFQREAKVLAALSHPGIVDVHDYGESEDGSGARVAYIVMELINGRPLDAVLREDGPMPPAQALGMAAQALDALHAAHRRNVVHRDIKPSNLMVREDGRVTVTDFGIARSAAGGEVTTSKAVLGTAYYIAPEQAEGRATTPGSDLYSMGVVCYELLTGELPFTGGSVVEIVLKHVREPAPDLPESFPQPVRDFVARALAKQPEDRFSSAAVMAAAARRAAGGAPVGDLGPRARTAATVPAGVVAPRPKGQAETEEHPRRGWRTKLIPLIIPCVVTVGAGTVVLIDNSPWRSDARSQSGQPYASVPGAAATGTSSPTGSISPAASGSAPVSGSAAPTDGGSPAPNANGGNGGTQQGASGGLAVSTSGPPNRGGSSGGGSNGGVSGGNTPGGGTTPGPTATQTQGPTVPVGCGGNGWGDIVNVGDGLRVGLASDSLSGGVAVVMGGHTTYGWTHTASNGDSFFPCNSSHPGMSWNSNFPGVELQNGYVDVASWSLVSGGPPGAYLIKPSYAFQYCLTDNGSGKQVTVETCAPGNSAQEWRIPAAG